MIQILMMKFIAMDWKESELENDDLKNYKAKAEYYVRQHQDNEVIAKLKSNRPLTSSRYIRFWKRFCGVKLEQNRIMKQNMVRKPLGEFVREIVGLDMAAAKGSVCRISG